jgi:hypothetical protein
MSARRVTCVASIRLGRLEKAEQFWRVAQDVNILAEGPGEVGDAVTTLLVHCGIAAADVICCARLGVHARGEQHSEAVTLLEAADAGSARHLDSLLRIKTKAGYSHQPVSANDLKKAVRAAEALLVAARQV